MVMVTVGTRRPIKGKIHLTQKPLTASHLGLHCPEHCSFLHRSSWISFSDSSETGVCLVRCDDGGGPVVRDIPSLGVTLVRVMRSSL